MPVLCYQHIVAPESGRHIHVATRRGSRTQFLEKRLVLLALVREELLCKRKRVLDVPCAYQLDKLLLLQVEAERRLLFEYLDAQGP